MIQPPADHGASSRFRARIARYAVALAIVIVSIAVPAAGIAALPAQQSAVECKAPEPVMYPTSASGATPVASPRTVPAASPIASPVASPVATGGVDAQIETAVRTIAVCQSERRVKTLSRFVTENFLSDVYAGGGKITKEQFIALGQDLPKLPVQIVSVSNVQLTVNNHAVADVVWTISNQLFHGTWTFVFAEEPAGDQTGDQPAAGFWLADGVTFQPVTIPVGASTVDVRIYDNTYKPGRLYADGPDVVLAADNRGKQDHELLILKLDAGVTTQALLTDPSPELPKGFTVVGQLTIPAGETGKLVLVGLETGQYAVVDLLPDSNGTPHLALGMQTLLVVQ